MEFPKKGEKLLNHLVYWYFRITENERLEESTYSGQLL